MRAKADLWRRIGIKWFSTVRKGCPTVPGKKAEKAERDRQVLKGRTTAEEVEVVEVVEGEVGGRRKLLIAWINSVSGASWSL
jgi:hypothetical protein